MSNCWSGGTYCRDINSAAELHLAQSASALAGVEKGLHRDAIITTLKLCTLQGDVVSLHARLEVAEAKSSALQAEVERLKAAEVILLVSISSEALHIFRG